MCTFVGPLLFSFICESQIFRPFNLLYHRTYLHGMDKKTLPCPWASELEELISVVDRCNLMKFELILLPEIWMLCCCFSQIWGFFLKVVSLSCSACQQVIDMMLKIINVHIIWQFILKMHFNKKEIDLWGTTFIFVVSMSIYNNFP